MESLGNSVSKRIKKIIMDTYKYILDRSSRKHLCPNCNKRRLVRYIDFETSQYLPEQYGRCDREAECAYHLNPYLDGYAKTIPGYDNRNNLNLSNVITHIQPKPRPMTYIPIEVLKKTRQGWEQNIFLQNLLHRIPFPFAPSDIEKIIVQYQLGTVLKSYMAGALTLPFIDEKNNICAIQVKQFNKSNHTTSTTFLHAIISKSLREIKSPIPEWLKLYNENESKVTCLFGAHLLKKYPYNPIALVEAPKTAIIGTLYYGFPETKEKFLWIAVYNKSSLSIEKCMILQGRTVVVFPDLNAYNDWNTKVNEFRINLPDTRFLVSELLEQNATKKERSNGLDLADYLIRFDYKLFRKEHPTPEREPKLSRKGLIGEKSENKIKQNFQQFNNDCTDSFYSEQTNSQPLSKRQPTEAQPPTIPDLQTKIPLCHATGKLKDLEDAFIRITQQYRNKPSNRQKIISLLDKYKRVYPNNEQLAELELMIKS